MNSFNSVHPISLFLFVTAIVFISAFSYNPFTIFSSYSGAILLSFCIYGFKKTLSKLVRSVAFVFITMLINPIFSQNGKSILLFVNDKAVTMESLMYGAFFGLTVFTVILWCELFTKLFSFEKFSVVISKLSPKICVLLSLIVRLIPMVFSDYKRKKQVQMTLGLFSGESKTDNLKQGLKLFLSVAGNSLESSVETAKSLRSKGFEMKKRTSFCKWSFSYNSCFLLFISVSVIFLFFIDNSSFSFYPEISWGIFEIKTFVFHFVFTLICFLPFIIIEREEIAWKLHAQKI